MRPRRSLLFVPADRPDRILKAATLPADAVIIDLEDGVDLSRKDEARRAAAEALANVDFGDREVILRTNSPDSEYFAADFEALLALERLPDTVMIPKVETPGDLAGIAARLDERGIPCRLIPCVESARAVLAAPAIAQAGGRNTGLMFGGFDFSADIGAANEWEAQLYARSQVVLAAAAAGIDPIDTPYGDFNDPEGLAEWSRKSRRLGFVGKCAIHPSQLEIINEAYAPTREELDYALRVVAAAEEQGYGAINLDGRMVDMAVVRVAQRTVAIARRTGMLPGEGA